MTGKTTQSPCRGTFISLTVKAEKIKRVGSVKFCFFHLKVTGIGFFFLLLFEKASCSLSKKIKQHISAKRTVSVLRQAHLPLQLLEGCPYREEGVRQVIITPHCLQSSAAELLSKQQF